MPKTVAQMTTDELRALLEELIEQKLVALLADPDVGLELRPEFEQRLRELDKRVQKGERGRDFNEVMAELGFS